LLAAGKLSRPGLGHSQAAWKEKGRGGWRSNTLSWLTLGTPKLHGRPPRKGSMRPAPGFPGYPRFVDPDDTKLPAFAADPPESYLSSAKSKQVVEKLEK